MSDTIVDSPIPSLFADTQSRPTFRLLATSCGFSASILDGLLPDGCRLPGAWEKAWRAFRCSGAFVLGKEPATDERLSYAIFRVGVGRAFLRQCVAHLSSRTVSQTSEFHVARIVGELEALESCVVELAFTYTGGGEQSFDTVWDAFLLGSSFFSHSFESLLHLLSEREVAMRNEMVAIHEDYRRYVVEDFGFRDSAPLVFSPNGFENGGLASALGLDER